MKTTSPKKWRRKGTRAHPDDGNLVKRDWVVRDKALTGDLGGPAVSDRLDRLQLGCAWTVLKRRDTRRLVPAYRVY